jgi:hypothetical protein
MEIFYIRILLILMVQELVEVDRLVVVVLVSAVVTCQSAVVTC